MKIYNTRMYAAPSGVPTFGMPSLRWSGLTIAPCAALVTKVAPVNAEALVRVAPMSAQAPQQESVRPQRTVDLGSGTHAVLTSTYKRDAFAGVAPGHRTSRPPV